MTIRVHRDEQWYKIHTIDSDDVIKHGMEKACILGNADKLDKTPFFDWWKRFPYIEQKRFYELLVELESDGHLTISKDVRMNGSK